MLKMLKINVPVVLKADPNDGESVREALYEHLQIGMEEQDLDYSVEDEEDNEELELEE
jgi:hypothetical protein